MADTMKVLSASMKKAVEIIINKLTALPERNNIFNIELTFASKDVEDEENLTYSSEIKTIRITQDYIQNFTDKIIVELELLANDYIALYCRRRNLYATLSFTRIDPVRKLKYIKPDFQESFRCVILDNADIFKELTGDKLNGRNGVPSDKNQVTTRMRVELINDQVYAARKIKLNVLTRSALNGDKWIDCRMVDMLRYCVNRFGFENAVITTPDNDAPYQNFVIPPSYGIADIMSYLQNGPGMGVYANGFCSYITQGCWYIYPRFGDGLSKRVMNVYSLGSVSMIEGFERVDWPEELAEDPETKLKDVTTHILINGLIDERNWSPVGTENSANAANIQIDDLIIDTCRTLTDEDKYVASPQIYNVATLPTDPIDSDNPVNIEFRHSHGNRFSIQSELQAFQITTIGFDWNKCTPFAFHPGTKVKYHFDHQDGYMTIEGMCERAEYVFERDQSIRLYPMFVGKAHIEIACKNSKAMQDGVI